MNLRTVQCRMVRVLRVSGVFAAFSGGIDDSGLYQKVELFWCLSYLYKSAGYTVKMAVMRNLANFQQETEPVK